jgi:hypothetical protein
MAMARADPEILYLRWPDDRYAIGRHRPQPAPGFRVGRGEVDRREYTVSKIDQVTDSLRAQREIEAGKLGCTGNAHGAAQRNDRRV